MDGKKKVLFTDVAGADEEKEELREVVEYLKDPAKYTKLGAVSVCGIRAERALDPRTVYGVIGKLHHNIPAGRSAYRTLPQGD